MTVPRDYDADPERFLSGTAAATLDLPLTLTMRGCTVYATKG